MDTKISHLRGQLSCPNCGNDVLEVVADGYQTNFLCKDCWTCWHWNLGWMTRVPPISCRNCVHPAECLSNQMLTMTAS